MKTALLILVLQATAFAQTPTLAEVARQERARQKATPSTVSLTNDTLSKSDAAPQVSTSSATKTDKTAVVTAKPETKTTDARPHDEAWWRDAFKQARTDVKRAEDRAKTLELELNQLNKDLLTRSDVYNREAVYGPQITAKNADLTGAKRDAEQARERIAQLEEDLRRAGAPAGWAR